MAAFETAMRLGLEGVHRLRLNGLARRILPCEGIIFALHRVQSASDKSFAPNRLLEVTPEFLEETIKTVRANGFDIISLDAALHRLASPVERPFACFTFDDAYRDNKDYAAPILSKHGVPFTIYVPEHFADGTGQLWWVELELAVAACSTLAVPEVLQHVKLACSTAAEKAEAFRQIYWRLRQMDEVRARAIVRQMCSRAGVDVSRVCKELIMSWDELRELGKNPHVTFGAHTIGHYAVAELHPAQALHEMVASKARVEAELGRECRHFCYPYGDTASASDRDFLLAQKAGFASAVTMRKGLIGTSQTANLMALPRCSLNGNFQDQRYVTALLSGLPFFLWNGLFERLPAMVPSRRLRPLMGGGQS